MQHFYSYLLICNLCSQHCIGYCSCSRRKRPCQRWSRNGQYWLKKSWGDIITVCRQYNLCQGTVAYLNCCIFWLFFLVSLTLRMFLPFVMGCSWDVATSLSWHMRLARSKITCALQTCKLMIDKKEAVVCQRHPDCGSGEDWQQNEDTSVWMC